ncbi:MAG: LexA family transcriptional regulator [Barnesiella sp.]|nr:LexA family transcriptional regulator [Bacteroidales bacterium]MBD5250475.1 LexA family transcriptional regulator [Barnesiella sp.]MBD5344861.1 LexA family transcriptional regulator [Bacteroides sp.]
MTNEYLPRPIVDLPEPKTDTVIDRIHYIMRINNMSQARFARLIGIDPSNLSKVLTGKSPVSESLINRIVIDAGVSKSWLRDGLDSPYAKPLMAEEILIDNPLVPSVMTDDGTPVYDIDVTAGCHNLEAVFSEQRPIGAVSLPGLKHKQIIVPVRGDSMSPTICDGGYVAIRPINDMRNIFWGQIYVVGLEEYRMVKFVRKHPDNSMVILHSANPAYDDMEVLRSDIKSLYLVENILNYSRRC